MIKKILFYIFLLLMFVLFTSCNKEVDLDEVRYEIEFLQIPSVGSSNNAQILKCSPNYSESENDYSQIPKISKSQIQHGYVWSYEYWRLKDGQDVEFRFWCQNEYHFIMRVYINGELFSEKEMVGLDESGGNYVLVNQWGYNNGVDEVPEITFTYFK